MKILVAGGAGYIGSHTCLSLLQAGHDLIVVDSLVNSETANLRCIEQITNRKFHFVKADLRDRKTLSGIFSSYQVDAVINFAGFKSVDEAIEIPLAYYDNNLNCAISLLQCMSENNVRTMVFSSSAAVYGEPDELPIKEDAGTRPATPYGRTKLYIEEMLKDLSRSDNSWKIAILRYFNPVGAHPSGLIGERTKTAPNNLMPYITKVAAGELEKLRIFGGDYDTVDGTAIRDYIHVMDLARGHGNAIQWLENQNQGNILTLNLGAGVGYSVLELLTALEQACGRKIPYEIVGRRAGDVAGCFADPGLAEKVIGWRAELGIHDICKDAWNWQQQLSRSTPLVG